MTRLSALVRRWLTIPEPTIPPLLSYLDPRAGAREFATSASTLAEQKFSEETVGLQTKQQFVEKKRTLNERMQEEARALQQQEDEIRAKLREEQRKKEKELAKASGVAVPGGGPGGNALLGCPPLLQAKLSFLDDHEGDGEEEDGGDLAGVAPLPLKGGPAARGAAAAEAPPDP